MPDPEIALSALSALSCLCHYKILIPHRHCSNNICAGTSNDPGSQLLYARCLLDDTPFDLLSRLRYTNTNTKATLRQRFSNTHCLLQHPPVAVTLSRSRLPLPFPIFRKNKIRPTCRPSPSLWLRTHVPAPRRLRGSVYIHTHSVMNARRKRRLSRALDVRHLCNSQN